ncbi:hypothetical protein [Palleronia marisminoris]
MADAEAIAEAAMRPTMRIVPVKSSGQQARAMLFRTRELLVGQRTRLINALVRTCQSTVSPSQTGWAMWSVMPQSSALMAGICPTWCAR